MKNIKKLMIIKNQLSYFITITVVLILYRLNPFQIKLNINKQQIYLINLDSQSKKNVFKIKKRHYNDTKFYWSKILIKSFSYKVFHRDKVVHRFIFRRKYCNYIDNYLYFNRYFSTPLICLIDRGYIEDFVIESPPPLSESAFYNFIEDYFKYIRDVQIVCHLSPNEILESLRGVYKINKQIVLKKFQKMEFSKEELTYSIPIIKIVPDLKNTNILIYKDNYYLFDFEIKHPYNFYFENILNIKEIFEITGLRIIPKTLDSLLNEFNNNLKIDYKLSYEKMKFLTEYYKVKDLLNSNLFLEGYFSYV